MTGRSYAMALMLLAGSFACVAGARAAEQKPTVDPYNPMKVLGTLTCSLLGKSQGTSVGVGRDMICRFQPGESGPVETYTGSVQGVGKSHLLFGTGAVLLAVKAPTSTETTPGMLTQRYAVDAASSGSAFAPLIGDQNNAIMLQPLAEQEGRVTEGKMQADAIIVLVELKLESTPA